MLLYVPDGAGHSGNLNFEIFWGCSFLFCLVCVWGVSQLVVGVFPIEFDGYREPFEFSHLVGNLFLCLLRKLRLN